MAKSLKYAGELIILLPLPMGGVVDILWVFVNKNYCFMVVEYFTIYARRLKQNQVFRNNLMCCERIVYVFVNRRIRLFFI